ncbi:sensor domain-containing protein [Nocardiopsis sp. CT-R113]|uniref:Sensor domain-containing protein n=1 Tax=Nocardiopsis codii TaxID=3065942 RepID=A0ABU7K476_9ACTN|nr:sensor domain-containing protein [Nocardiopsis sp. CT-R113]MEE2037015.1 sensor domain-containing protein [Nocardiopsis sp. CT-R113]
MNMTKTPFAQVVADSRYNLWGLPLALVSFTLVVVGLAVGAGTAVVMAGMFLMVGTLHAARGLAHVERIRLADLHDRPVVRRPYRSPAAGSGPLRRALGPLACRQSWLDALHAVVRLPVAAVGFGVTTAWWVGAAAGLLHPLWGWSLYTVPGYTDLGTYVAPEYPVLATTVIHMLAGALLALSLPLVVRGCAHAQSTLGRALLLAPEDAGVRVYTAAPPHGPAGEGGHQPVPPVGQYVSSAV